MPKVSVIIPVFNASEYLKECLDSVVNQSLSDIEIICVNDGSTDNSLEILNEYADKYDKLRVISQENKGAGAARNVGLDEAKGTYLAILDADDIYDREMLEKMYNNAINTDADVVLCKSQSLNHANGLMQEQYAAFDENIMPVGKVFNSQEVKSVFKMCILWSWDKLFKRSFIDEYNLRFQELRSQNDMFFVSMALILAERIFALPEILATHRIYLVTSIEYNRDKNPDCFLKALHKIYDQLKFYGLYEKFENSFVNFAVEHCLWHLESLSINNVSSLIDKVVAFWEELKIFDKPIGYFDNYFVVRKISYLKNQTLFPLISDVENINCQLNIINSRLINLERRTLKNKLKNIFSVQNSEDKKHKIIRILGFKIQFRI